jgi:serine/threonine protein kinase
VDSNTPVAIKVLRRAFIEPWELQQRLFHELVASLTISHPNIIPLLGICPNFVSSPAIISPWFASDNAEVYIKKNPEADRMRIIRGVASALAYMHAQDPPILHGSLRPENILVSDGEAMVYPFHLEKIEPEAYWVFAMKMSQIPLAYLAPELYKSSSTLTTATDVYAFGGTCLKVLTGKAPFQGMPIGSIARAVVNRALPRRPSIPSLNDWLWTLLVRCWDFDPSSRPNMEDVLTEIQLRDDPTPTI